MAETLDEQYLIWLYARIGSVDETRRDKTYWSLLGKLFTREFVWLVPNDDNRVEDGRYMRYEFLEEMKLTGQVDQNWMGAGCSVLEMLMGVASRLSFEADRAPTHWFWELLTNLGLSGFHDMAFNDRRVDAIIDKLIWRTYKFNGQGGLFPLRQSDEDQREIEIWYQMNLYLQEQH